MDKDLVHFCYVNLCWGLQNNSAEQRKEIGQLRVELHQSCTEITMLTSKKEESDSALRAVQEENEIHRQLIARTLILWMSFVGHNSAAERPGVEN